MTGAFRRNQEFCTIDRRTTMIDLHCHILPGIDDGAPDLAVSIAMAKAFVADGVSVVACTPHILPGLYHNSGPQIREATERLQANPEWRRHFATVGHWRR